MYLEPYVAFNADMLLRYTFGKPVAGKLTVNMTVNGVGYYRHEMGHPVIKNMEVGPFSLLKNVPKNSRQPLKDNWNSYVIIGKRCPVTLELCACILRSKVLQTSAFVLRT